MGWVVDASVAVAWFVELPYTAGAVKILESTEPLIAPELILSETANAAYKLVRGDCIPAEQAYALLVNLPRTLTHIHAAGNYLQRALELALEWQHPVYDCLYAALAEQSGYGLVTADRKLAKKVSESNLGIEVGLITPNV